MAMGAPNVARYLSPLLKKYSPASPISKVIVDWCWNCGSKYGIDLAKIMGTESKSGHLVLAKRSKKAVSAVAWKQLRRAVGKIAKSKSKNATFKSACMIADMVGLEGPDFEIFFLIATVDEDYDFESLLDELSFVSGVGQSLRSFDLYIPWRVSEALLLAACDRARIEQCLMGTPARSTLAWSDFDFVERERDFAADILRSATKQSLSGVNILLYGEPGMGKTELAKLLAQQIDCECFVVAEDDSSGAEPSRHDRLSALRVADRIAMQRGNAVLLFDEMEDVLSGGETYGASRQRHRWAGSKVHFNRLLETNKTPIIWTANNLELFDPAFIRRMQFVIKMKTPPRHVRAMQWNRLAKREGVKLSESMSTQSARDYSVAPSFAQTALHAAKLASADEEALGFIVSTLYKACHGQDKAQTHQNVDGFDLSLVNSDCNLLELEKTLSGKHTSRDVSFFLYGPPGTGKSAFATHLAMTMGLEVIEKRASDLLSKWVGETEEKIAEAFDEARQDEAMLVINEAESFFWDRAGVSRSWETSMVNEFLVGLERCPVPVVCTSNHLERMDPAALRRFTFKVKLDYLNAQQIAKACHQFFDMGSDDSLSRCSYLTPGDFALIKRQLRFHRTKPSSAQIARMLEEEAMVKQKGTGRIGF